MKAVILARESSESDEAGNISDTEASPLEVSLRRETQRPLSRNTDPRPRPTAVGRNSAARCSSARGISTKNHCSALSR